MPRFEEIIYGLDASGSMKGNKLKAAKKAGIALAFKAIEEKNTVLKELKNLFYNQKQV